MIQYLSFQIGEILKKKFDGAQEVRQRKRRGRRMLEPRFQRFKPHTDTDLVFLKESPSYCEMDIQQGSLGTRGRECDPVSSQKLSLKSAGKFKYLLIAEGEIDYFFI